MRQLIFVILFSLLVGATAWAENFQIYATEHAVTVKLGNEAWKQAKKKLQLHENDSIRLAANAGVKLLAIGTGQIYEWKENGTFKVQDVIDECLYNQSNWLKRLFTTVIENITSEPEKIWYSTGHTKRGLHDDDVLEHALAKALMTADNEADAATSDLLLTSHDLKKKEFYFDITNKTSETLYVNVLAVNPTLGTYTLVYDIRDEEEWMVLPVAPGSTLSMQDFRLTDRKNYQYIVFGTKSPISVNKLLRWLQPAVKDHKVAVESGEIVVGRP